MEIDIEEFEPDPGINWSALSDDVWIRVLHNLDVFSALDVARFVCVNKAFYRAGHKFLRSLEEFEGSISRRKDVGTVLLWVLERCPKLLRMKATCIAQFGVFPKPAARCVELTHLELFGLKVRCEDLRKLLFNKRSHWPTFPNLRTLNLKSLQLTGRCVKWLQPSAVPHLTSLTIQWCTTLNAEMIVDIFYKLRHLSLRGCHSIYDSISSRLYGVEELDVAFTSLTDKGLEGLTYGCPALRKLTLAHQHHNNWEAGGYSPAAVERFSTKRPQVLLSFVHC